MSGRKGKNDGFFGSFLHEISRIKRNSNEDFGQRHEAYKESSRANSVLEMKNCSLKAQNRFSHLLV